MMSFKKYLDSIAPTKKGSIALLIMLLIVPFFVDLIIVLAVGRIEVSLIGFIIGNYLALIPVLLVYLLVFYLVWIGWTEMKKR